MNPLLTGMVEHPDPLHRGNFGLVPALGVVRIQVIAQSRARPVQSGARENHGVAEPDASPSQFSPRTVWAQRLETPLRQFLRTETGSAAVLLAATLAALAWANIDRSGDAATWHTVLMIRSGTRGLADSWQGWVNSGLMAFFFLVAGLEARREFDLGELRERRRVALPLVVALGGMVVPAAVCLAINSGRSSVSGWGTAMSAGTAFALGALALPGPGVPDRVRPCLLTFAVAGDVAGIAVIALACSGRIDLTALAAGAAVLGAVAAARRRGVRDGPACLLPGAAAWAAFFGSGVDPVAAGPATGLLAVANLSGCAAGSRSRSWPATRGTACGWRSRRKAGSSSCPIPGQATRCPAPPAPSSTWRSPPARNAITSAARTGHRSRSRSTATSSAPAAAAPGRPSGSSWPATATRATQGGTCR
jgi:hypothetical protein